MSEFPYIPLFTDAFLADTGHLSAQETGAYVLLLVVAWRTRDCRLPDDDVKLARWARVDRRTWARIKPTIMSFWTYADGSWAQARLDKEREYVSKRAAISRANGAAGGRPKSLKTHESDNPAGNPEGTQTKALTLTPTPRKKDSKSPPLSQLASLPKKIPDDNAPLPSPVYAFESGIIRLNERDLKAWVQAFPNINVPGELIGLTAWAGEQKTWFSAVSQALAKKDREMAMVLERIRAEAARPKPKPYGYVP